MLNAALLATLPAHLREAFENAPALTLTAEATLPGIVTVTVESAPPAPLAPAQATDAKGEPCDSIPPAEAPQAPAKRSRKGSRKAKREAIPPAEAQAIPPAECPTLDPSDDAPDAPALPDAPDWASSDEAPDLLSHYAIAPDTLSD